MASTRVSSLLGKIIDPVAVRERRRQMPHSTKRDPAGDMQDLLEEPAELVATRERTVQMERTSRVFWRRDVLPAQNYVESHGHGCNYVVLPADTRPYIERAPTCSGPVPSDIECGRPTVGMHPALFGIARPDYLASAPSAGVDGAADGTVESVPISPLPPTEKKSMWSIRSAAKTEETSVSTLSKSQKAKAKWRSLISKIRDILRLRKKEKVVVETVETVPAPILKKKTTIIEPALGNTKETGSNESLLPEDEKPLRTRTASSKTLNNGKMNTIVEPSFPEEASNSPSESEEEIVIKAKRSSITRVKKTPTVVVQEASPEQAPVEVEEEDVAATEPDSTVVVAETPPDEPAPAEEVEVVEVVEDKPAEEAEKSEEVVGEEESEEVEQEDAPEAESAPPEEVEEEVIEEKVVEEPAPEPMPKVVKAKTVVIQEPAPEPEAKPKSTTDGGTQTMDGASDDCPAQKYPMPVRRKDKLLIRSIFKAPHMATISIPKRFAER